MSLREPKVVSDLRQLTVAVFKMSRGLPKHLRPTVAGRIEQHSLDAWLGTRHFALTAGVLKSKHVGLLDQALGSIETISCLLELCLELRAVSVGAYGELIAVLEQIRRQLFALQKKYADAPAP